MQLYDINGSYYPSFFYMLLETNEDISTALDKYTQTFIHEFIHYLQDLILPYNIRLNLTNLALFGDIRQSVMETGELVRPFTKWNENSVLLRDQRKYTLGKSEFLNNRPCIESIKKDYFVIPSTGAKVYKYAYILQKFLLHVETKEKSCPIYELCNANGFICNKSCKVSPCLNVNDNGDCPYSMFLKSYNLASAF